MIDEGSELRKTLNIEKESVPTIVPTAKFTRRRKIAVGGSSLQQILDIGPNGLPPAQEIAARRISRHATVCRWSSTH